MRGHPPPRKHVFATAVSIRKDARNSNTEGENKALMLPGHPSSVDVFQQFVGDGPGQID